MMLVRMSRNIPFRYPANAWERSVNWTISHYPIAVYWFVIVPLLIVPLWVWILT